MAVGIGLAIGVILLGFALFSVLWIMAFVVGAFSERAGDALAEASFFCLMPAFPGGAHLLLAGLCLGVAIEVAT